MRLAIYSNADAGVNAQRRADIARLRDAGVIVLGGDIPAKPDVAGFRRALDALAPLGAREVAMVGDNYFTDGGAIRAGVHFIKVVPVSANLGDGPLENLSRGANIALRVAFDVISRLHEHLPAGGNPKATRL